jgi:hypothetical protein
MSSNKNKKLAILISLVLLAYMLNPWLVSHVSAADLSSGYVRLDRMKAAVATGGLVCVTPSATHTTTAHDFQIDWPTGYTVSTTATDWNASTGTIPAGTTAFPGIVGVTAVVGSQNVTWTFSSDQTLTQGTEYCFTFGSSALTNPAAANDLTGTLTLSDTTAANTETKPFALSSVSNDQVTVTATVPATFSFAVQDNSISLGTLSPSSLTRDSMSSPITVSTNANNGWTAQIRSEGDGALDSASTGDSISSTDTGSAVSLSSGTKGYVWDVAVTKGGSSTGTPAVDTEYKGGGDNTSDNTSTAGGVVGTSYEEFANSTGPASIDSINMTVVAAIDATTKAASDYTDTVDIVGAGQF